MTTKDAMRLVERSGTKIAREKLIEALRRAPDRDFYFVSDVGASYALVRVPLA